MDNQPERPKRSVHRFSQDPFLHLAAAILLRGIMDLYQAAQTAARARFMWLRYAAFWAAVEVACFMEDPWGEIVAAGTEWGENTIRIIRDLLKASSLSPARSLLRNGDSIPIEDRSRRMALLAARMRQAFPGLSKAMSDEPMVLDRSFEIVVVCERVHRMASARFSPALTHRVVDRVGQLICQLEVKELPEQVYTLPIRPARNQEWILEITPQSPSVWRSKYTLRLIHPSGRVVAAPGIAIDKEVDS